METKKRVRKVYIGFSLSVEAIELLESLSKGSRSEFVERLIINSISDNAKDTKDKV